MNLNCPICAELFLPSDDVFCTTCGHMFHHTCLLQWLERSKTCPQCRNKCSQKNIFKVYFNQANLDTSKIDVGSLQEQLDNANLKIKMKELETNKATKEIAGLKEIQKKCIKTITALEEKVASNNHVVSTYAQQMQVLKSEIKVVESLRSENKALKTKLQLLDTVNDMITANQDETERLLRECKEIRPLGICITSLKKELRNADSKKTELRNMVKALQNEVRKGTEVKKMLEDRISTLESENFHLKEKVSNSNSLRPSHKSEENRFKQECQTVSPIDSPADLDRAFFHDECETPRSNEGPQAKRSRMNVLERLSNPSSGIRDKVKQIEDSTSPYLNIKSSNVDLQQLFKFRTQEKQSTTEGRPKLSIMEKKKPLLTRHLPSSNLVYNGVGGSTKASENDFPNRDLFTTVSKSLSVPSSLSNRLKSGRLKKLPSSSNL